jgi:hypothetical protein
MRIYLVIFDKVSNKLLQKFDNGAYVLPYIEYNGLSLCPEDWLPEFGLDCTVEYIRHESVTSRISGTYSAAVYSGIMEAGTSLPSDYVWTDVHENDDVQKLLYVLEAAKVMKLNI